MNRLPPRRRPYVRSPGRAAFLCTCLLVLCAAPLAAQGPQPAPQHAATGVPRSINRSAGLHTLDGELWGCADGYKVRFASDGFEFTPALGRAAARNYPLTFRVQSIGRGAVPAPLSLAAPTFRDLRVEYDRGVAVERYDVGVDGIEQSFVFHARPAGSGDLLVRGRLTTDLTITPEGDGLRCELPGVGGCRIGAVVGIDGNGVRVRGGLRYAAGVLELSLPAAFVDQAALPLTLDPLIGSSFRLQQSASPDDRSPLAAFDATTDTFLVVWTTTISATDTDVHGQRVSRAGVVHQRRILIHASTAAEDEPQVAGCDGRDAFVVVCTRNGGITARAVAAATGAVSSSAVIAAGAQSFRHRSTVSTSWGNDFVVCAWQSDAHRALQATRVVVAADLTLSAPGPVHTFGDTSLVSVPGLRPRLAKSDGGTGRHALAFQRDFWPGNSDVRFLILDGAGMPILPEGGSFDASSAEDTLPEIDGDGTNWVVAWQRRIGAGPYDIVAISVSFDPTTGQRASNTSVVTIENRDNSERPGVVWTGDSCVVGWTSQLVLTPGNGTARIRSVDPFLCTGCEGSFTLSSPFVRNGAAFGCGVASGGAAGDDALLVWDASNTTNLDGGVFAQLWQSRDGAVTSLGGGCGDGGTQRATCARSPNANFRFHLRAATGEPAVFVLSGARRDFPCGSCTLVPDPTSGVLLPLHTGLGDLSIALAIPAASPVVGVPLFTQWATLDLTSPPCALFRLEMSNALRVVIE